MINILLVDANTVYHVGNAALLESTIEQLKTQFLEANIKILAFDPNSISKMFTDVNVIECLWARPISTFSLIGKAWCIIRESVWICINTLNLFFKNKMRIGLKPRMYTFSPTKRAVIKAYLDTDIVISISAEMLNDHSWKRLTLFLYGYWLAYIMGKIVSIYPQSIGPIDKWPVKAIARYVLNKCDLILPRDQISLANVMKLGIQKTKVHLVPDVAVNQPYISSNKAKQFLKKEGIKFDRRPLIGITISKFRESDYQKYFFVIKQLCQLIVTEIKGEVVFFSPNLPYSKEISDLSLAHDLYKELSVKKNVTIISNLYSPSEFKGMLGELDLFISSRMHASILSTMCGTPTITINTQPKLKGYMKMVHQETWACDVEDFTIEKAPLMVKEIISNSAQVRESLAMTRLEIGHDALMASKLLKDIYDREHKKRVY